MYTQKKEGHCPKCGSDNLYYHSPDIKRTVLIRYISCCDCDQFFKEYAKITYSGCQYDDEDGIHRFDANGHKL